MGVGVFSMVSVITAIKQSSKGRDLQQLVNEETYVNLAEEAELYKQAEMQNKNIFQIHNTDNYVHIFEIVLHPEIE